MSVEGSHLEKVDPILTRGRGLAECVHRVGKNEKDNQKECVGEMKKKRWKTKIIHDVN